MDAVTLFHNKRPQSNPPLTYVFRLPVVAILFAITIWSAPTQGKEVLGLSFGATFWRANMQGRVQSNNFTDADDAIVTATGFSAFEMNIADTSQFSYFVEYRHKMPFFPKVLYRSAPLSETGKTSLRRTINFVDFAIASGTEVESEFDLSYDDITLYFTFLDTWMLLDIGATQRSINGAVTLTYLPAADPDDTEATTPTLTTSRATIDSSPVMLYGHSEIPLFNSKWNFHLTLNYTNEERKHFSDSETRLAYTMERHGYDYTIEFGYKRAKFISEDIGDLSSGLAVKGPFLRLSLGL